MTVPVEEGRERPYEDQLDADGLIVYHYRRSGPAEHSHNLGLRLCMRRGVPLAYLVGIVTGEYMPAWPVFVVRDDPVERVFSVAVDLEARAISSPEEGRSLVGEGRREYVTRLTQQRLHQIAFRVRVLRAYLERCAVCRLRHAELLDAAHILPDGHPKGEPIVSNGLALCKLHHAAFDRNFLGIRPDYLIEIRQDLLIEHDGPMLQHGLREFHQQGLLALPKAEALRPNREFLAERYELFRQAG